MLNKNVCVLTSVDAAIEAGGAILKVYKSDFKVEEKADQSPLTLADMRSHDIIVSRLSQFNIPILSEEGKDIPYEDRKKWDTFWLVDPLDGTKEFVKRNGEFTVNIALIQGQKSIVGVIFVPDKGVLYFASDEIGSYRADVDQVVDVLNSQTERIRRLAEFSDSHANQMVDDLIGLSKSLPISHSTNKPITIVGSRSHSTPELEAFVEEKRRQHGQVEFISAGSSLKICLVAEGRADIYPRLGPTMEWDTAAGQAVAENAGARLLKYETTHPLIYNKENLLNPWFIVSC